MAVVLLMLVIGWDIKASRHQPSEIEAQTGCAYGSVLMG